MIANLLSFISTDQQKLKIVGVGYRIESTNESEKDLLTLKLGYSHYYYVKVPQNLKVNCFK